MKIAIGRPPLIVLYPGLFQATVGRNEPTTGPILFILFEHWSKDSTTKEAQRSTV